MADGTPGLGVVPGVAGGALADALGAAEDGAVDGDARSDGDGDGDAVGVIDGEAVPWATVDGDGPDPPNRPTAAVARTTPATTAPMNTTTAMSREPLTARAGG
jgi:hypothetical protein